MNDTKTIAPITRTVRVAAPAETAFALFTAHIGSWWPLGSGHSVYGKNGLVAFEGDLLVERFGSEKSIWGEVLEWHPPSSLRLSWHPGSDASRATDLRVTFEPGDDETLVTLVHSGWEKTSDPEAMARNYDQGWAYVLGWFGSGVDDILAASAGAGDEAAADELGEWYALRHSAGPALADSESIFATEAFGEHIAFLQRLSERGLLVAAGPLPDGDGEGMTIVRVLPEHGELDVYELATTDDRCVAQGYLRVEVKPWAVRFTA